jgi:hypothetical protein
VRRGLREILADALPDEDFTEVGNGDEVLGHLGKSQTSMLVRKATLPMQSFTSRLAR